ncbi:MAG: hypothetical protein ABI543_06440 [Ignavibacteria bacterium]
MKITNLKLLIILIAALISANIYSQNFTKPDLHMSSGNKLESVSYADSLKKNLVTKRSISALFIGIGGGLGIPTSKFSETANPVFGILGRMEFSSTGIFPFVIGGEVNYYSFNSPDEFRTVNLLSSYRTKILAIGLNIDYSLSKLIRSSFTMPFLSVDVKSNNIKRDFDVDRSFEGLPATESKISFGAGVGFTVFIFDFSVKYNYMKDNSFVSVTTKTKFPIIRF